MTSPKIEVSESDAFDVSVKAFHELSIPPAEIDQSAKDIVVEFLKFRRTMSVDLNDGTETEWGVLEIEVKVPGDSIRSSAVGIFTPGSFIPHQCYRLFGQWEEYQGPNAGKFKPKASLQFRFKSYCEEHPVDRDGAVALLARYGTMSGAGVGKRRCEILFDTYGHEVFNRIVKEPEAAFNLLKKHRFQPQFDQFQGFVKIVKENMEFIQTKAQVMGLLAGRGFPMASIEKFVKKFALRSFDLLKRNPHLLLTIPGFGISRVDQLYLDLGGSPIRPKRVALAVMKMLADDNSGSVWHYERQVRQAISEKVAGCDIDKAMRLAKRAGLIRKTRTNSIDGPPVDGGREIWVADWESWHEEDVSAALIDRLAHARQTTLLGFTSGDCTDHQIENLRIALSREIGIFCGGPGTGKTHAVSRLIVSAQRAGMRVIVGCPTGMARKRILECLNKTQASVGGHLKNIFVGTWHGLGAGGGEGGFIEPIPCDHNTLVVGDESSMCDQSQMYAILNAYGISCGGLLLVGDPDQLPPVGAGSPFVDMINSGVVPVGRLTEVHRNKGGAVLACHAIRRGRPFSFNDEDFLLSKAGTPDEMADAVLNQVSAARLHGLDPINDIQVICAVNEGHAAARYELNLAIQGLVNAGGEPVGDTRFRIGDKVVCRKNAWFEGFDFNNKVTRIRMCNGEIGIICGFDQKTVSIKTQDGGGLVAPIAGFRKSGSTKKDGDTEQPVKFELGYAISGHASQGSEWPRTIVVLDPTAKASRVAGREWLTTVITRHRDLVICIGQEETAKRMAGRSCINKRKTFLAEGLRRLHNERLMLEI